MSLNTNIGAIKRKSVRNWNQNYLKYIRYADYDQANATQFLVSVEFYYDDETLPHALNPSVKQRADPFSVPFRV